MNEQLYDIYDHWHQPFWQTQWFRTTIFAFGALVLVILLFWMFRKYYKNRTLTPLERAVLDLEQLKNRKINNREDAHASYFTLTSILKTFFQSWYHQRFESMSDYEMIANLRINGLSSDHMNELEKIINSSLSVKYARENALHDEVMQAIDKSITIISDIAKKEKR